MRVIEIVTFVALLCIPLFIQAQHVLYFPEIGNGTCASSNPCGWVIYERYTKKVQNIVQSNCDCPDGTECSYHREILSKSAYEYRCSLIQNETDSLIQNETISRFFRMMLIE